MNVLQIILVLIVSFFAGMEGILDEWELHRPIIACTLVGLALGNMTQGIILGGAFEMIALGWMNIGAAVAPDAALASVVSAFLVCGPAGLSQKEGLAIAIPLAVAGQVLTIFVRSIVVGFQHRADTYASNGNTRGIEFVHIGSLMLQGLRITIPTAVVMAVSAETVQGWLNAIPDVITNGLSVAGGFIVAVGYAMVINMMAANYLMPFFFLGFVLSAISELNLIALGIMGLVIAIVYLQLSPKFNQPVGGSGGSGSGGSLDDELDAELNDL